MTSRTLCALFLAFGAVACTFGTVAAAPSRPAKMAPAAPSPNGNLCPARKDAYPANTNPAHEHLSVAALTKLADGGDADAMVLLGLMYAPSPDRDATSPPIDIDKAIALFERASVKGNGFGAYLMGVAHVGGTGVPQDEKKAFDWFQRSADNGTPLGLYWVGEMMAKGRGGRAADWKMALPYFSRAAAGGVPDAYVELGFAYDQAEGGLTKDREKAAYCFRQATADSVVARFNLRTLIDQGLVTWQPGDPGEAPKPK